MRTTLKIVLPLIVSVAVVSLLFAAYQVRREKRILRTDLSRRAEILGESLQEGVEPLQQHRRCAGDYARNVARFQIAADDSNARFSAGCRRWRIPER